MKKILSVLTVLLISFGAFAQISENLSKALENHDTTAVSAELNKTKGAQAKESETAVLDEVKKAVSADDLDYAYSLAETVLMFDFDNAEAQKLFTSIEKAKKAKAETQARKEEENKKQQEAEEQKKALEEYHAAKEAEAQAKDDYIESVSSVTFKNFPMSFALSPAALDFAKSPFADTLAKNSNLSENNMNIRYGLGGSLSAGFNHPYFYANLRFNFNYFLVPISGEGKKTDLYGRISLGIPKFSNYLRLCVAYGSYSLKDDSNSALYTDVSSPRIGFGFEGIHPIENLKINVYCDMDLITFDEHSEIDYAYGAELDIRYNLKNFENKAKLYIESATRSYSLRVQKETEWNLDTVLSLGVILND